MLEGIPSFLVDYGLKETNPARHARTLRTRSWQKIGESLRRDCLAKGRKEGVGGKMAKFVMAIAYGKGVVGCYQYEELKGAMFASFVDKNFPAMFKLSANPKGELFLQDGDPSQNCKAANDAMDLVGCRKFSIPPGSADLNPIENTFHLIGKINP